MDERPWLRNYDPGVPHTLAPYPETTLVDVLAATAREQPSHAALMFKGSVMTAGELDRLSSAFAAALRSLGVKRGDRVALLLPNCPQFLVAKLGAWKAGAIAVPSTRSTARASCAGRSPRRGRRRSWCSRRSTSA